MLGLFYKVRKLFTSILIFQSLIRIIFRNNILEIIFQSLIRISSEKFSKNSPNLKKDLKNVHGNSSKKCSNLKNKKNEKF